MNRRIVQLSSQSPVLRHRASTVKDLSSVATVIEDLYDTWPTVEALGIAAPQIGASRRLFVFRLHDQEDMRPEVLINPKVVRARGHVDEYEGCLSVARLYGHCVRAEEIEITALDREGNRVRRAYQGYNARIIQHEMDHLDGVLYVDRVTDWDQFHLWVPADDGAGMEMRAPEPEVLERLHALVRPLPGYALQW